MKNMKLKLASALSAIAMCSSMIATLPTSAATYCSGSKTASSLGKSFSSKWSKPITIDIDVAGDESLEVSLTVGYDTWCQHEDYVKNCWAPTGVTHYAKVKNSQGTTESTNSAKGGFNTGKADVKHTGSSVTYYGFVAV